MMTNQHVDYVATYFPHKIPTKIQGQLNNTNFRRLETELHANASSIDSQLGGGDYGYLSLVKMDAEYLAIIGAHNTCIALAYPGPLIIPPTAIAVEAVVLREQHR